VLQAGHILDTLWAFAFYAERFTTVVYIAIQIRDEGAVFIIGDNFDSHEVLLGQQRRHTVIVGLTHKCATCG
jgi:hypothetical protein